MNGVRAVGRESTLFFVDFPRISLVHRGISWLSSCFKVLFDCLRMDNLLYR